MGYACQNAQMLFRRPRGLYFTARDRGDMHAIVQVYAVSVFSWLCCWVCLCLRRRPVLHV